MTIYTRKIQIVGKRSYSVSLPKKWIIKHNLEKKEVHILEKQEGLLIAPKKVKEEQKIKEIVIDDLQLIQSILILFYTRAVSKVKLVFKNKEDYLSAKPLVLEILSHLEGFKIINEENNSILISDSYENSFISIEELIKRTIIILNNMVDCIINDKIKTKKILENELDNVYHLSKRVLYLYSKGEFDKEGNILDIEEIFLWRLIFKKLENIGDILEVINKNDYIKEDIGEIFNKLSDFILLNKKIKISEIIKVKEKNFKNEKNKQLKELIIDVLNNLLLIELNKEYFSK